MLQELQDTWNFRDVIVNFVRTSLAVRYRRSVLGYIWTVLGPVMKYLAIGFVFQTLGKFDMPSYYGYMFLGSIYYGFVASIIMGACNAFVGNEHFIKKIYVPKLVFVLNLLFYEFVNFILVFLGITVLLLMFQEVSISLYWAFVVPALCITLISLVGLSIIIGIATVYFRDLPNIIEIFVQMLFFATPIMYPAEFLEKDPVFRVIMEVNPLYYMTELFRSPLLENRLPSMEAALVSLGIAILSYSLGILMLRQYNNRMVFKL